LGFFCLYKELPNARLVTVLKHGDSKKKIGFFCLYKEVPNARLLTVLKHGDGLFKAPRTSARVDGSAVEAHIWENAVLLHPFEAVQRLLPVLCNTYLRHTYKADIFGMMPYYYCIHLRMSSACSLCYVTHIKESKVECRSIAASIRV